MVHQDRPSSVNRTLADRLGGALKIGGIGGIPSVLKVAPFLTKDLKKKEKEKMDKHPPPPPSLLRGGAPAATAAPLASGRV